MRRSIIVVASLVALGLAALAAVARLARSPEAAQTRARVWPAWLSPCAAAGAELAYCGGVAVPESADAPGARQIRIRVIVIPATAPTPLHDPLVLLSGGPGQGAADLASGLARAWAFARRTGRNSTLWPGSSWGFYRRAAPFNPAEYLAGP